MKCAKQYRNDGRERNRQWLYFLDWHGSFARPILPMWGTKAPDLFDGQEILTVICPPGSILVHRSNQPGIGRQSELKDGAAW